MRFRFCLAASLVFGLWNQAAWGKSFTWDAGLGLATVSFPAYRGSADRQTLSLPIPTLSISSRDFNLGRSGAQIALNQSKTLSLRLSITGSLPVKSDESKIREGMPDLMSSLELGPALSWNLWSNAHWSIKPEVLLRGVVATDLQRYEGIGWMSQPRLSVHWLNHNRFDHIGDWKIDFGPVFGSRQYHDYFYGVAPRYANTERESYTAHGGFSGWRLKSSMSITRGRWSLYSYLAYDDMGSASFRDSPLVEVRHYWLFGFMSSWRFWGPQKVELNN